MCVGLYRDGLESSLVDSAESLGPVRELPPPRMSRFEPVHEARQFAIDSCRDHIMPMVRHDGVREKFNAESLDPEGEDVSDG